MSQKTAHSLLSLCYVLHKYLTAISLSSNSLWDGGLFIRGEVWRLQCRRKDGEFHGTGDVKARTATSSTSPRPRPLWTSSRWKPPATCVYLHHLKNHSKKIARNYLNRRNDPRKSPLIWLSTSREEKYRLLNTTVKKAQPPIYGQCHLVSK